MLLGLQHASCSLDYILEFKFAFTEDNGKHLME